MKRYFFVFLCALMLVHFPDVSARSRMLDAPIYEENYSWDINDRSQKKQAIGMTVTGVVLFFLIAAISGAIQTSTDGGAYVPPLTETLNDNTIISG